MDDQRHSDGPPQLFEQSAECVQLLFDHDRNLQLLGEWLAETYTVQTPDKPTLDDTVDLCLVDDTAFADHQAAIREWKHDADPVFAPVLLVSDEQVSEEFGPDAWGTIDGLYVVDDVISTPIKKPILHRRMENLLERRTLSKSLDSKYRRSEERFDSLFRTLPDPAFVTDGEGRLRFVNDALTARCDVDRDGVRGDALDTLDCFDDETAASLTASIESVGVGETIDPVEIELHTADGGVRLAELNASAGTIEGKRIVTVVLRDVTERHNQEQRLAESEARFRQIARHLDEVIWMIDADRNLLYLSPGYERLTGRSGEQLQDSPLLTALEDVHPEDKARISDEFGAFFDDIDDDNWSDAYHFEYRLVDADGTIHWVETDAYPVTAADRRATRIVGLINDITAQKDREHELERQNDRLEEFAGIVSHDLRNPLQVITARLELFDTEGENADHTEAISRAAERMERLIDDLLSLARQGETVSTPEPVKLTTAADLAWGSVAASGASMSVETDAMIEADASRLQQLFENLFRNAMEHGVADDANPPAPRITVGALEDGFYVADDGPGIPEDQRDRVFEQGYTTQTNGTGFGLNIVADIVAAHGWTISVTESERGGARFEIRGVERY